jgi:hypothetical protein
LKFSLRSGGSASNRTEGASNSSVKSFTEQRDHAFVAPFDRTEELSEAFRYFDVNGDGKISATELGFVLFHCSTNWGNCKIWSSSFYANHAEWSLRQIRGLGTTVLGVQRVKET